MTIIKTFSLDEATLSMIEEMSVRLNKPMSEIVRLAIFEYYQQPDQ